MEQLTILYEAYVLHLCRGIKATFRITGVSPCTVHSFMQKLRELLYCSLHPAKSESSRLLQFSIPKPWLWVVYCCSCLLYATRRALRSEATKHCEDFGLLMIE